MKNIFVLFWITNTLDILVLMVVGEHPNKILKECKKIPTIPAGILSVINTFTYAGKVFIYSTQILQNDGAYFLDSQIIQLLSL